MRRAFVFLLTWGLLHFCACKNAATADNAVTQDTLMASVIVDPMKDNLRFFWKNPQGYRYASIARLRESTDSAGYDLQFAMNAGMYLPDGSPQGLYIERGQTLAAIDTLEGTGNFYMKPNGIFFIGDSCGARIVQTSAFIASDTIAYATQSGPMLVVDDAIHPAFRKGSANLNIRNGVGILDDGRLIFAISRRPINFYEFASWFKDHGCKNALYLDGFVSRAYIPTVGWEQFDGDFGVMIGGVKPKH